MRMKRTLCLVRITPAESFPLLCPPRLINFLNSIYMHVNVNTRFIMAIQNWKRKEKSQLFHLVMVCLTLLSIMHVFVQQDKLITNVLVKNTSDRKGVEIVQLYVGFSNSLIERPVKLLKGFKRVALHSKEEQCVEIICELDRLRYYNAKHKQWELERIEYVAFIGPSSDNRQLLSMPFTIPEHNDSKSRL